MLDSKRCTLCKQIKFLTEFYNESKTRKGKTARCKKCTNIKNNEWKQKNFDKYLKYQTQYAKDRKEKKALYDKEYRKANRKKINEYFVERNNSDPLFKLATTLRKRIYKIITNKKFSKNNSFVKTLGCDLNTLKDHLQQQFKIGMCWDNHGEWHIDHIIPLSSAKTVEEMNKLCHYTNLQPLWAEENISKSNKIEELA